MEITQSLQCPGWKTVPYGKQTLKKMKNMLNNLEDNDWDLPSSNCPLLAVHIEEILQKKYMTAKLVDGWIVIGKVGGDDKWICRDPDVCRKELKSSYKL